jgi:hypothetical protein
MVDKLFQERARDYLYMYPDAHKRLGISKKRMQGFVDGKTTRDPVLRQKIIRRGLTAAKRRVYVGAFRTSQRIYQDSIDNETNPTQKAKLQKEKDQAQKDFNKGIWQPQLKEENAKVNSRVSYQETDIDIEYPRAITI